LNTWHGPKIQGIAVGNGCTGKDTGICGAYEGNSCDGFYYEYKFLSGFSFFNTKLKNEIEKNCDWKTCVETPVNTTKPDGWAGRQNFTLTNSCMNLISDAFELLGHVNVYDVMGQCDTRDYCDDDKNSNGNTYEYGKSSMVAGRVGDIDRGILGRSSRLRAGIKKYQSRIYPDHRHLTASEITNNDDAFYNEKNKTEGPAECIGSYNAAKWMNTHYNEIHGRKSFCWGVCNRTPKWEYNSTRENLPRDLYPRLIGNMEVTIYNGDVDSCVPYTDNEAWTEGMNYTILEAWHPWAYTDNDPATEYGNQVGGYKVVYDVTKVKNDQNQIGKGSFQFVTIRGAGHMVPQTQPAAALEMFRKILSLDKMTLKPMYGETANCNANKNIVNEIMENASAKAAISAMVVILILSLVLSGYYWFKSKHLENVIQTGGAGMKSFVRGNGNGGFSNKLDISDRDVETETRSGLHAYDDDDDYDNDNETTIEFTKIGTNANTNASTNAGEKNHHQSSFL
jgi:hypothetical protein